MLRAIGVHAFVTYDDIRDAEDAKRELDKKEYAAPARTS
jgi:hypothetical protein